MSSKQRIYSPEKKQSCQSTPRHTRLPSLQEEPKEFEDVHVIKLISKTRFPVYLATTSSTRQKFALKLYDYKNGLPNKYYINEARFEPLDHPSIIQIICAEEETSITLSKTSKKFSCILMEYAPYGDFFEFIKATRECLTDKLIRTYFRQLIEGLDYLHKNDVFHLDLKLENLLMGTDYQLKIADFDLSYFKGDSDILSKGTKFYRAPELRKGRCRNPGAADIYAAGVLLFVLKCGGVIPHPEDTLCEGVNLEDLLENDPREFFKKHLEIQGRDFFFFEPSFRELFTGMMKQDPRERMTLKDIMKSKWYIGPVYSKDELRVKVKKMLDLAKAQGN